jgi:hypothetical protein
MLHRVGPFPPLQLVGNCTYLAVRAKDLPPCPADLGVNSLIIGERACLSRLTLKHNNADGCGARLAKRSQLSKPSQLVRPLSLSLFYLFSFKRTKNYDTMRKNHFLIGKVQIRRWNVRKNKFNDWESINIEELEQYSSSRKRSGYQGCSKDTKHGAGGTVWSIRFPRGGGIKYYPSFVDSKTREQVISAMEKNSTGYFRQYEVQTNEERRVHCLLSFDDEDVSLEKGYKYHTVNMKAVAHVKKDFSCIVPIAKAASKATYRCKWNIGVELILYRCLLDRIGAHADDTQNEQHIFTVVIDCGTERWLHIKANKDVIHKDDYTKEDFELKIFAAAGDAYCMDGKFWHSPKTLCFLIYHLVCCPHQFLSPSMILLL